VILYNYVETHKDTEENMNTTLLITDWFALGILLLAASYVLYISRRQENPSKTLKALALALKVALSISVIMALLTLVIG